MRRIDFPTLKQGRNSIVKELSLSDNLTLQQIFILHFTMRHRYVEDVAGLALRHSSAGKFAKFIQEDEP